MKVFAFTTTLAILFTAGLVAQELPKMPPPTKEHEWLKQLVGEWETDNEAVTGPGQPAMKCKGTISSRALGGYWVVSELNSDMFGTKITAIQTLGYDTEAKKYVGTWVDNIMGHLWKYDGKVDGKKLTLEAEGPDMSQPGKTAKYRDVYEFKSADQIALSSFMQGPDGKWISFMAGTANRKK